MLLAFPVWAVVINGLVRHYYGAFIHMDLPWGYGRLGKWLVSLAMHCWHHVKEGKGVGANFATVFAVFDRAFGTFHLPGPCTEPLGVKEIPGNALGHQLMLPFRRWLKRSRETPFSLSRRG